MNKKTQQIINEREKFRNQLTSPLVGDYVKFPDGQYKRFTHDWGPDHGLQVTNYFGKGGDFYLLNNGYASYSGGLDPRIPYSKLKLSEEKKEGTFWVFKDDLAMAHNGIYFMLDCKVWNFIE
jgi:hypothetical protein